MHLQPIYKEAVAYVTGVSDDLFANGICLPSGSNLSDVELTRVCQLVSSYFTGVLDKAEM
jgi:dTDP-4-amino-4,6-dideoxygalactose transaminase